MKKVFLKVILMSLLFIFLYYTKAYCVESGTVRMQIIVDNDKPWTNINISESYDECESLNSSTSTLGTTSLKAHLTTDADWSAMAIFSVSQYGGARTNSPTWTNGNSTGIKNIGVRARSTGILNSTTKNSNSYVSGLFNENGLVKKYISQWNSDRIQNNFIGLKETWGWLGSSTRWGPTSKSPCFVHIGLFEIETWDSGTSGVDGCPNGSVTFRPVIWN